MIANCFVVMNAMVSGFTYSYMIELRDSSSLSTLLNWYFFNIYKIDYLPFGLPPHVIINYLKDPKANNRP